MISADKIAEAIGNRITAAVLRPDGTDCVVGMHPTELRGMMGLVVGTDIFRGTVRVQEIPKGPQVVFQAGKVSLYNPVVV